MRYYLRKLNKPLPDRERVEFEELNKTLRHLTNVVWTVPSVLFAITFLAFKNVIESSPEVDTLKHSWFGIGISFFFIIGWILNIEFVNKIMKITYEIIMRMRNLNPYWKLYLRAISKPGVADNNNNDNKKDTFNAIETPYGKIVIWLSLILIAGWFALFLYFLIKLLQGYNITNCII